MRINIIHLPQRRDRFELLTEQLSQHLITDYTIWPGIISKTPATGISRAHKQIVQWAKTSNLDSVLIAEDDFKFTSKSSFSYFINHIPPDFDLYLASVYQGNILENQIVERFSGLTFYVVNSRFYDTFLTTPEFEHLDLALSGNGKYVVCSPFTVIQHNGFSDNNLRDCNYDFYLEGKNLLLD